MADTITSQTLTDTKDRAVIVLTNISDGTGEALVSKINASALVCATKLLTLAAGANTFKIGETITTGNATSISTAVVADVNGDRTILTIISLADANNHFVTTAVITGATTGKSRVQSGAIANVALRLAVSKILYNIASGTGVQLWWAGNTNSSMVILTDSGIHDFDAHGFVLRAPEGNFPTGNILLSTIDFNAGAANSEFKGMYSLILEVKKVLGYQMPNYEINPNLGYANDH